MGTKKEGVGKGPLARGLTLKKGKEESLGYLPSGEFSFGGKKKGYVGSGEWKIMKEKKSRIDQRSIRKNRGGKRSKTNFNVGGDQKGKAQTFKCNKGCPSKPRNGAQRLRGVHVVKKKLRRGGLQKPKYRG